MRTAAAKGKSSWRLIAAGLAVLVAASAAEASRYTPASANDLLDKQRTSSLVGPPHAADLAPAFAFDPAPRFPLLTAADRQALAVPLAEQLVGELEAALEGTAAEKLASGGQTSDLRPNLRRIQQLTTISHPSRFGYARARWYDARNASWLSEDPAQDVDSPNLYAYVAWQPQMATDPMGMCTPCANFFRLMNLRDRAAQATEPIGAGIESAVDTVGRTAPVVAGVAAVTAVSPPVGGALAFGLLAKGSVDAGVAHYEQQTTENPYYDRLGESLGVGLGRASGFSIPVQLATGENIDTGQALTSVEKGQLWGDAVGLTAVAAVSASLYPAVASEVQSFGLFGGEPVAITATLRVSRSTMPQIAQNIEDAIAAGAPSTLTRITLRATIRANRRAALRGQTAPDPTLSLDEYPFASTAEGGAPAQVRPVPRVEQNIQGGHLSLFYQRNQVQSGQRFHVRIVP